MSRFYKKAKFCKPPRLVPTSEEMAESRRVVDKVLKERRECSIRENGTDWRFRAGESSIE